MDTVKQGKIVIYTETYVMIMPDKCAVSQRSIIDEKENDDYNEIF